MAFLNDEQVLDPIYAVGGVLYRVHRSKGLEILIIKKRRGFWTLPKGRIEPGESPTQALRRELSEETGLRGSVIAEGDLYIYPIIKGGQTRLKHVRYYLVQARKGKLRLSRAEQIERARWCALVEAARRVRNPRVRHVVLWAARELGVVIEE